MDNCIYGNYIFMLLGASFVSIALIFAASVPKENKHMDKRSLLNLINCYVLWLGRHTILIMAFDYQSMSLAVRIARKMLGNENWIFVFIVKIMVLNIVIVSWHQIVQRLPNKVRNIIAF